MIKMKRIYILLSTAVLSVSLIGCQPNEEVVEEIAPKIEENIKEESENSEEEIIGESDINENNDDFYMYGNIEYGFRLKLPLSWEEHSVFDEEWVSNDGSQTGVINNIRHPEWTEENPRQDIPIMIFNHEQWELIEKGELNIGAAPISPKYLGENDEYVFALPARYNFSFPTGYEEVEDIMESNPLEIIK
ncbi:hypothetical protein [Tissierella sp. Yu-01]|uniref:hypothetical protein n=1 Tax=Tissierella sp. Yu-01 TaxID=3035694 RepID=UPI00240DBAF2|nr:hypothetical protein [Tissierella sp. Yu-01]WFA07780.1 hypothetical protein P3962_08540 [Tissierella sp. Yu-01]